MSTPDPLTFYLATHDAPCPGCGYNLRGLKAKICPECGRSLSLRAILRKKNGVEIRIYGPEKPGREWYIRAGIALAVIFGGAILFAVVVYNIFGATWSPT